MSAALHKDFEKVIRSLCHRHQVWQVFADFCEMAAMTYANVVFKDPSREERYLKLVGKYEPAEAAAFPPLLGITIAALEDVDCDFLGEAFMSLELGSHWKGQFFTPFALCRTMAELQLDEALLATIEERGFVTASDPACGAGATLIAFIAAVLKRGANPQTQLHITAQDIDSTAAHMCFVQLSILGIPAAVILGDTLRMTTVEVFRTPAHHLGLWDRKVERGFALGSPADTLSAPPATVETLVAAPVASPARGQLAMFDLGPSTRRERGVA